MQKMEKILFNLIDYDKDNNANLHGLNWGTDKMEHLVIKMKHICSFLPIYTTQIFFHRKDNILLPTQMMEKR